MTKKILVTGTNGAFGGLFVRQLLTAGHEVAASMRDIAGRNKDAADALSAAGAIIVELDVTDDVSVTDGVRTVVEALGGLDVLINNVGGGAHGLLEAFEPEQLQRLFDINVVGVHRVTRAVLPTLRAQGSGLIVNLSSLLGRVVLPFYGPYTVTKFALEAMTETYRAELSGFGVDVALIEPGGYATSFIGSTTHAQDTQRLQDLSEFAAAAAMSYANYEKSLAANSAQDPKRVAEAMVELIAKPAGQRPFRTVVDFMGMAEPISGYNEASAGLTRGLYENIGIAHMLSPNIEAKG